MSVLNDVIELIRSELGEGLAEPDEKDSHPGKRLSEHVRECLELSSFISDRFGMGEEAKRFSSLLCYLHDLGKLHPKWGFGVKGFSHSEEGAQLLERLGRGLGGVLGLDARSLRLLILMVRKHHSSLRFESYKEHREIKLNFEESLLYADSFGAFKLADFASANGLVGEVRGHLERGWPGESSLVDARMDQERLRLQREASEGDSMLAAPTGWGKTMVGLLRAVKERPVKLFYCLPTVTAIRKMKEGFERVLGDSVGEYFYFVDFDLHRERGDEGSFELELYRFFVPMLNVITVDQLLLSMMRAGKYHFRRFQFRNSLVVVDEYHLLPPRMLGALVEVLSRYSKPYGMKLLLMTATPLRSYKEALRSSLDLREVDLSGEYSRLRRHRMELIKEGDAVGKVEEMVRTGMRVLVVLNTVDRAVSFYRELEADGKLLLHSRFSVKDRYERERRVDSCRVLVATQVAEVSLDVSFDALVSDSAPVPSVIQRAGRVNRYGRETDRTNVLLIEDLRPEPYSELEVKHSLEVITGRMGDLEREGERAYLSMLADYDGAVGPYLKREISESRRIVAERVFSGEQLGSMELNEEVLSKSLRGETNVLVVPEVYEGDVRTLLSRLKGAGGYSERKLIYSELKGFLAPLSVKLVKRYARPAEGMPFLVASYDRELGIVE